MLRSQLARPWRTPRLLRPVTTAATPKQAWLYFDSLFPVRRGSWDLRDYFGLWRQESILSSVHEALGNVKSHNFGLIALEPRRKDGGVFVDFSYSAEDDAAAIRDIINEIHDNGENIQSWNGLVRGGVWHVKGRPWLEDLNRYASSTIKVHFDGPDIREDDLYNLFRPFGKIKDITPPAPGAAGNLRSSIVTFRRLRSATIAHNCLQGLSFRSSNTPTKLITGYVRITNPSAIREWMANHPRITIPLFVLFLGSLTFIIFDPLRIFSVEGKLLNWFDYRDWKVTQWLRRHTTDRLSFSFSLYHDDEGDKKPLWREKTEAALALRLHLADLPRTLMFIHGPQGSGKTCLVDGVLKATERPRLVIKCSEFYKAESDAAVVAALANQTGYWPHFKFLNSFYNLIDVASVAIVGSKAGLSESLESQMKGMLAITKSGLTRASTSLHQGNKTQTEAAARLRRKRREQENRNKLIAQGLWHDGRLDCVAGNGIMSELGIGDEYISIEDLGGSGSVCNPLSLPATHTVEPPITETLPIVVLEEFSTKKGKENVSTLLAQWAASLVEGKIAHVVVISDNRENMRQIAEALPSKPLDTITLHDADPSASLAYVTGKLQDIGVTQLSPEEVKYVERLGGRSSDLEMLVYKVRGGQKVKEAVEEIINNGVNELRKVAFGDGPDDVKKLPWTRQQAWKVLTLLVDKKEVPYYHTLLNTPFKGDEEALINMERAELIDVLTDNGRPSAIKAGRPVYQHVFRRLVTDAVFKAIQEIEYNDKQIASKVSDIKACEEELVKLKEIETGFRGSKPVKRVAEARAMFLANKMKQAEKSLEALERKNAELNAVLAKGDSHQDATKTTSGFFSSPFRFFRKDPTPPPPTTTKK